VAFATNAAVITSSASIGIEVVVVDVAKVVDVVAAVVVVRRRITGINQYIHFFSLFKQCLLLKPSLI
jgi:hypothetical protein